jgi:hypothetical protein
MITVVMSCRIVLNVRGTFAENGAKFRGDGHISSFARLNASSPLRTLDLERDDHDEPVQVIQSPRQTVGRCSTPTPYERACGK